MSEVPTAQYDKIKRDNSRRNKECHISEHECRAMRQLDRDGGYTIGEIAFMFECQKKTASRHVNRDCHHNAVPLHDMDGPAREYQDKHLLTAFRIVYDRTPVERMSQEVYNRYRPDHFPSSNILYRRFGSWETARAKAWGDGDD